MKILEIDNENRLVILPEALSISQIATVWDRDSSRTKSMAIKELSFVVFYADYKSSYVDYNDVDKTAVLKEDLDLPKFWKPDTIVYACIDKYRELQLTFSMRFLEAAKKAGHELMDFLGSMSLKERDKSGKPLYKPKDITTALSESSKVLESIDRWSKKVMEEESTKADKIYGGGEKGRFETEAPWLKEEKSNKQKKN